MLVFLGWIILPMLTATCNYDQSTSGNVLVRFVNDKPTEEPKKDKFAAQSRFKILQQIHRNHGLRQMNAEDLPMIVKVKLYPVKIHDLIERNEVMESTVKIQLNWKDQRLAWNPLKFSNVTEIVAPAKSIWSPDIAILNSAADIYHVVRDTRFEVKVHSDGQVWWHPTGIVHTYCKLFLYYYPLDTQNCKYIFESPTLDNSFMKLTFREDTEAIDLQMFAESEAWNLINSSGKVTDNKVTNHTVFSRLEFRLTIKRSNVFHVINFILPSAILSSVQVLFYLLPATHPQRVGSSTTILLSVIVFQTVVVAQLPKTSSDVPILSTYIFFLTFLSALSVSSSVLLAKFIQDAGNETPLPTWLSKIPDLRHWLNLKLRGSHDSSISKGDLESHCGVSVLESSRSVMSGNSFYYNDNQCCILELRQSKAMERLKQQNNDRNTGTKPMFTNWIDVSNVLDAGLCFIVAPMAIFTPIFIFVVVPKLPNDAEMDHM